MNAKRTFAIFDTNEKRWILARPTCWYISPSKKGPGCRLCVTIPDKLSLNSIWASDRQRQNRSSDGVCNRRLINVLLKMITSFRSIQRCACLTETALTRHCVCLFPKLNPPAQNAFLLQNQFCEFPDYVCAPVALIAPHTCTSIHEPTALTIAPHPHTRYLCTSEPEPRPHRTWGYTQAPYDQRKHNTPRNGWNDDENNENNAHTAIPEEIKRSTVKYSVSHSATNQRVPTGMLTCSRHTYVLCYRRCAWLAALQLPC